MKTLKEIQVMTDRNKLQEAITELEYTLNGDPKNAQTLFLLGVCHFRRSEFKNAEDEFRNTVAQDGAAFKAWYYLGLALEKQERQDEAQQAFKVANSLNGKFKPAKEKLQLAVPQEPAEGKPNAKNVAAEQLAEDGLAKGIYTDQKNKFVYYTECFLIFIITLIFALPIFGGIVGGVIGVIVMGVSGSESAGILVGGIVAVLVGFGAAIANAGSVKKFK